MRVRPLAQTDEEIAWVARHMRETLIEVLGNERGETMYTLAWLDNRVREHIDGRLEGAIFVAVDEARLGYCMYHPRSGISPMLGIRSLHGFADRSLSKSPRLGWSVTKQIIESIQTFSVTRGQEFLLRIRCMLHSYHLRSGISRLSLAPVLPLRLDTA
jgi:hypothetical protein